MKMLLKGAVVGAFAALYLTALSACMPRNDGAGDLFRVVQYGEGTRK